MHGVCVLLALGTAFLIPSSLGCGLRSYERESLLGCSHMFCWHLHLRCSPSCPTRCASLESLPGEGLDHFFKFPVVACLRQNLNLSMSSRYNFLVEVRYWSGCYDSGSRSFLDTCIGEQTGTTYERVTRPGVSPPIVTILVHAYSCKSI